MILTSDIVSTVKSRLDAEGSDYYNFDNNIKPAINESIRFILSLMDYAVEKNKVVTEALYPLQKAVVYQLSQYSRFTFSDVVSGDETVGQGIWSIRSINPLPLTQAKPNVTPITHEDTTRSIVRTDLVHKQSFYECKRLTKEEWEINALNPFKPGNVVISCSTLQEGSRDNVSFAYLNPYDYNVGQIINEEEAYIDTPAPEIEIRPYIPNKLVTVFFVCVPSQVSTVNDIIPFHTKLYNFLVEKCLQYIAYQQGDQTSIFQLSQKEIQNIVTLFS